MWIVYCFLYGFDVISRILSRSAEVLSDPSVLPVWFHRWHSDWWWDEHWWVDSWSEPVLISMSISFMSYVYVIFIKNFWWNCYVKWVCCGSFAYLCMYLFLTVLFTRPHDLPYSWVISWVCWFAAGCGRGPNDAGWWSALLNIPL